MEVYRSKAALARVQEIAKSGCAATIGAFDGLHLGHKEIVMKACEVARQRSLPSLVFSFDPTPKEYLNPAGPPARLTRFRERVELLKQWGVDYFFCPRFGADIQQLTDEQFLHDMLLGTMHPRSLVVGDDFRFGRDRHGDIALLERASVDAGFDLVRVSSVFVAGQRVSSTAVRKALSEGDFELAEVLLGRRYSMSGRVMHGRHLGRTLGFPTANISTGRRVTAVKGVFAVRVRGLGETPLPGVANLGTRPTVQGGGRQLLEVHIFDFDQEIYGEMIQVEFVTKIRDEMRFENLAMLTEQIRHDSLTARAVLGV